MRELPKGWVSVELAELFVPRSARLLPVDFPDAPYIGLEHVEAHTNKILTTIHASEMASSSAHFLAGDILYGRMRPYLNKVALPSFGGLASAEFIVFPEVAGLENKFFLKRFSATDFVEFACSQYEGDRPRVKFEQLGRFRVLLPPSAEQTRIVAKLEELLSDLDAGVAELKAAQKKLGQYRQSLLKAAVEGKLTAAWRKQNTPTETGPQLLERILKERRTRWEAKQLAKFAEQGKAPPKDWQKKYPEPVKPDTTDLPELPEGWVWASVEQLAELVSGHTPKDASELGQGKGEIPWFKVGDMNQEGNETWMTNAALWFSRNDAISLGMKVAPKGTIIFPKRGGAIATNKKRRLSTLGCYDLNTMGLVAVGLAAEWLWNWFLGVDLGKLSDGSNVPQINNPDIAPLPIPIPPLAEQNRIISLLVEGMAKISSQTLGIEHSLKQSAAQRKNILKAAFSGQLVPQDPEDEPASALLERIRAERVNIKPRAGRKRAKD